MGIDAKMFVKLPRKLESGELKKKAYIFGSMFKYNLILGMDEEIWHHPLEEVTTINGDGYGEGYEFQVKDDETFIKVPLSGRYYGIGYERGTLMTYTQIAEFLERMFPEGIIYYGGDSSGVAYEVFDKTKRDELITYFIEHGHDPYNRFFDRESKGPICPVCDVKMVQNGWGPNYELYSCIGCGWIHSIRDGITKKGFRIND